MITRKNLMDRKRKRVLDLPIYCEDYSQPSDDPQFITNDISHKFDMIIHVLQESFAKLTEAMANLNKTTVSLSEEIRRQQYAIERLEKQVSDLQVHALHGQFAVENAKLNIHNTLSMTPY